MSSSLQPFLLKGQCLVDSGGLELYQQLLHIVACSTTTYECHPFRGKLLVMCRKHTPRTLELLRFQMSSVPYEKAGLGLDAGDHQ